MKSPQRTSGFTLVELMVAITILGLMMMALSEMISFVSKVWINGIGAVDNFTKARGIMDLMDRDVKSMVFRADTTAFVDASGGYSCAFYTNIQGSPGADFRKVSLVQYALNPSGGTTPEAETSFERLNYGMNFMTASGKGITPYMTASMPASPAMNQLSNLTTASTETIATGVIRFQCQFVDGSGNLITPSATTPFSYNHTLPSLASNPRSMIVSILVLSNVAERLTSQDPAILTEIQTDFDTNLPTGAGGKPTMTFSQYWSGKLDPSVGVLDTSLPPPVREGLRVFSRSISLPVETP